jgi:hypothetical protein
VVGRSIPNFWGTPSRSGRQRSFTRYLLREAIQRRSLIDRIEKCRPRIGPCCSYNSC